MENQIGQLARDPVTVIATGYLVTTLSQLRDGMWRDQSVCDLGKGMTSA